jgi:hypothetical protein
MPSLEAPSRPTHAMLAKMAAAGAKHTAGRGIDTPQGQCVVLLYTFGPEGDWIKGLVAEKP